MLDHIWQDFVWHKQTLIELSRHYQFSIPTIRSLLERYTFPETLPFQELLPQKVVVILDAFYTQRGQGIIVVRAPILQRNLLWFDIRSETVQNYVECIETLLKKGWQITAIVVDGKPGVIQALRAYAPIQHCQFHQLASMTKHLTKHPTTPAAQALRALSLQLTQVTRTEFTTLLDDWYQQWQVLLKERTIHPTGRWSYTHARLRRCYRSLRRNLPYLFTYQAIPGLPNTTNSFDGSISYLRTLLRVHRGSKLLLKRKITQEILRRSDPRFLH